MRRGDSLQYHNCRSTFGGLGENTGSDRGWRRKKQGLGSDVRFIAGDIVMSASPMKGVARRLMSLKEIKEEEEE